MALLSNLLLILLGYLLLCIWKKICKKIFKIVLKAFVSFFDGPYKKFLKPRSPNVYCNKSHIKNYFFCQQCKDYFIVAKVKNFNCIFLQFYFCMTAFISISNSTNRKIKLKIQSSSIEKSSKPFFVKAWETFGFL